MCIIPDTIVDKYVIREPDQFSSSFKSLIYIYLCLADTLNITHSFGLFKMLKVQNHPVMDRVVKLNK